MESTGGKNIFPLILGLIIVLFVCGCRQPLPILAPGQDASFVVHVDLPRGAVFNGPDPIKIFCPEAEFITCSSPTKSANASPIQLEFHIADLAGPGIKAVVLKMKFQVCRKSDDLCFLKNASVPVRLQIDDTSEASTDQIVLRHRLDL